MILKKRIRNLDKHVGFLPANKAFYAGMPVNEDTVRRVGEIGFTLNPVLGECVLPGKDLGPRSYFNAEGGYVPLKDEPKETVFHKRLCTWTQWVSGGGREEVSETRYIPFKRYQRESIPAPGVELTVIEREGQLWVISPKLIYTSEEDKFNIHVVNLMLELFGACFIIDHNLELLVPATIKRLNWEFLPSGGMPWQEMEEKLDPIIRMVKPRKRAVITERVKLIQKYNPEFVAVGKNGFRGYMVFGFPKTQLYVLESIYSGNATYVFQDGWERLSQMTKGEILNQDLAYARLIHRPGWEHQVKGLLDNHFPHKTSA